MRAPRLMNLVVPLLAVFVTHCGGASEQVAPSTDSPTPVRSGWPMYRGDLAGTGYSPLTEITPDNVSSLTVAWSYSLQRDTTTGSDNTGGPNSQATPIVVNDVMYLPAADRIVALDPTTGDEIWRRPITDGAPSRRGVAYWPGDSTTPPRVLFSAGRRLIALDAASGEPVVGFGQGGEVDMVVPYNSVPLVYENLVVVGANTPPGTIGGVGNARAFDARTGDRLWEFSSVPQPGSVGHDTWEGDSWEGRLGANAWPFYFTMDEERDLLYLPLASPIPGEYGGDRPGANLFGNSVVAVNVHNGEYVWHFQTIHHDLWDADPPAPPVLFDISGDGSTTPALGLTTKSGYLYILNRETGEPIFGVEERPVAESEAPGEQAFPTQPIPIKPPPMARVSYEPGDLVTAEDTTAEHAAACAAFVENAGELYNAGPFTPWLYRPSGAPPRATLLFPGLVGGPNWGGAAFDPDSQQVIVFSQNLGSLGWLEDADAGFPVPYRRVGPRPNTFAVEIGGTRLPCQKPPWGQLTAVDVRTGDISWRQPLGLSEVLPEGKRNTGRQGRAAAIVTASGLIFIASTDDDRIRALDTTSGQELWVNGLDARGNANPMTYLGSNGRQYVALAATDTVAVFGLP